jgi:DNA processing protein
LYSRGYTVVYPRANRELFGRVRQSGEIVSEYFLGEAPLAWRFPARNRVIAGLCDTLVVVEAAEKSGALITARHALEAGRDVWAVPGPPFVAECRGSNRLLADGAAHLWDIAQFVETVAPRGSPERGVVGPSAATEPVPDGLPQNEALALAGVGFEPTEVDVVAGRSGGRMREFLPALALLELKGYVTRNQSGAFLRRAVP